MVIADVSIKRPVFITVIFIVLLIIGGLCYTGLTVNDMPEAEMPTVAVSIVERGASAEQLETKVIKNVEEAVGQISGVKHISSTLTQGAASTVIEFYLDKSVDVAAQEVKDKISGIRGSLPGDIEDPVIVKFDPTAKPVISLVVSGTADEQTRSQFVDDVLTEELYTVKGVGSVDIYGKEEREIQIRLDKGKMASFGVTAAEIVNSLKNDNIVIPGGKVSDGDREITLNTNAGIKNVQDFNDIIVSKRNNTEIRIKDVADVIDGVKEKDSISLYQGEPAIGIDITKQSGANTVAVANGIKNAVALVNASLPQGIQVEIVRDNSVDINASVQDVLKTILEGCILAIIIVFLFLREWESTLICAVSLPTSIITTFIAMKLMNFSLNTISLIALSLAVGLLIDDAIVVIENIVRHLHMGKSPLEAAKAATSEIGLAVLATTLAVVAVFLPVAMVSGVIGKYFMEFGLTVAFSMLVSLFVSFTLTPMMSSKLLKIKNKVNKTFIGKFLDWFNHLFDLLSEKYGCFLRKVLKRRLLAVVFVLVLFAGSMMLIPHLGFTFIPSTDNSKINITELLDSGLTLQSAGKKAAEIENILDKYSEVEYTYTTYTKDNISIFVTLSDKKNRKYSAGEISSEIREDLKGVTGVETTVRPVSMGAGGSKDISFIITGDDFEELQVFAQKAYNVMRQDPHAVDVGLNYKAGQPEASLEVDRDSAADLGVSAAQAADTIRTLYNGVVVTRYDSGKEQHDVRVSLKDEQSRDLDSLDDIYISGTNNQMIPLNQVTQKVFTSSSSVLHRYDRSRQIELSANVSGIPVGNFTNMYMEMLQSELDIPSGMSVTLGGITKTMQEGFDGLIVALIMGILFIFLVMAAQFESFIDPVSIMFSLPFAMIGAIIGLYITASELSIVSLMGIILLMGLVAKNAILLIDFAKQRRRKGIECDNALVEAGTIRLRPILMTTLAMIFGMLPIALAKGTGTEMRAPMAYAVIGGLITSTILTLFVVPVIYSLIDDLKKRFVRPSLAEPGIEQRRL